MRYYEITYVQTTFTTVKVLAESEEQARELADGAELPPIEQRSRSIPLILRVTAGHEEP